MDVLEALLVVLKIIGVTVGIFVILCIGAEIQWRMMSEEWRNTPYDPCDDPFDPWGCL